MDTRLLDILVCPICKGPLDYDKKSQELICRPDKLAYPIRDGIPIMWAEDARDLNAAPVLSAPAMPFPTEPEPEKAAPASPPTGKPLPPARPVTDAPSTGSTTSDIPSGGGE